MKDSLFPELPEGLAMALAQNIRAFEAFSSMDDAGKRGVIDGARAVSSPEEMRDYAARLAR